MPAYAAGATRTALYPGDPPLTLFNGTETVASGLASMIFLRGNSPSSNDAGSTFNAKGMASDMVIDVQEANEDVDGSYTTTQTIGADASGNGTALDIGRGFFYRVKISTYTTGTMPVVTVAR